MKKIMLSIVLCISSGLNADASKLSDQLCESPEALIQRTLCELKTMPEHRGDHGRVQQKEAEGIFRNSQSIGEFRTKVFETSVIPPTKSEMVKLGLATIGLPLLTGSLLKVKSASKSEQAKGFVGALFGGAITAYLLINEGYVGRQCRFITGTLNCSECLREALIAKTTLLSSSGNHIHAQSKIKEFENAAKLCFNHQKETIENSKEQNNE